MVLWGGQDYESVPQKLSEVRGLVIRQRPQPLEVVAQAFQVPYEAANKYKISVLPTNKVVKNKPSDPDGWEPTSDELDALDTFLFAHERSSFIIRTALTFLGCCHNIRPFKLNFSVARGGNVYVAQRPFRLGGWCCQPMEMSVDAMEEGRVRHLGRVREDYAPYMVKCCLSCVCCTNYAYVEQATEIEGEYETKYKFRVNRGCCGRTNNCCGGTCCQNDAVYDILDSNGKVVAHLQQTFAGGKNAWLGAVFRTVLEFNSYLLEFPPESTAEERILLLTTLFQIEFTFLD